MFTPQKAKKLAEARGYYFYFDRDLWMWACYPTDDSAEASYHTASHLAAITAERFEEFYLPITFKTA